MDNIVNTEFAAAKAKKELEKERAFMADVKLGALRAYDTSKEEVGGKNFFDWHILSYRKCYKLVNKPNDLAFKLSF